MLVRMCSIMAGPVHGNAKYGDVVKVPTEFGEDLIKNRHAIPYVEKGSPPPKGKTEVASAPKDKQEKRGGRRSGRNDSSGS